MNQVQLMLQYISRIMYMAHGLCCYLLVWFYPYPFRLLYWYWGHHMIVSVPVKQAWKIWVNIYHNKSIKMIWQQQSKAQQQSVHVSRDIPYMAKWCIVVKDLYKLVNSTLLMLVQWAICSRWVGFEKLSRIPVLLSVRHCALLMSCVGVMTMLVWGSFHYWESELTFGNLTNLWRLANQKVS